ncbi:MAG: NAD-dependent epimerase/dehydratase family protein [bacterium JZ-2024 1]
MEFPRPIHSVAYYTSPFPMKVLVTGGWGYLGKFVSHFLKEKNIPHLLVDNLSHSAPPSEKIPELRVCDVGDEEKMGQILKEFQPEVVVHLAAKIDATESWKQPLEFWQNNVVSSFYLLRAMKKHGIRKIIYSSSAAIYSAGENIGEDHPPAPLMPYGKTKFAVEKILQQACRENYVEGFVLRIFNLAGALPECHLGEDHQPETHLIPLLARCALGKIPGIALKIGFPTPDGSSIRDYVSVVEVARLIVSLLFIPSQNRLHFYQVGSGTGYSALTVLKEMEQILGKKIPCEFRPAEFPEPPVLTADISRIRSELPWSPQHSLRHMLLSTLKYELKKSTQNQ